MKTKYWLFLLLLVFALIEPASASTVLDSTVAKFQTAANTFGENIKGAGIRLLMILATIQLSWTVIQHLIKGAELTELLWIPVRTIFVIGFYFTLIKGSSTYLPQIIQSFDVLGQRGSGLGPLTPSDIISQGFDVSFSLLNAYKENSATLDLLTSPFAALIAAWSCIMICLCFVMIGAQMALALVSGYLWAAVTPFLLGFGSLSFTRDMANNALKGGISVGMKILCCYFVAGVASDIAPMLGEELAKPSIVKISSMLICSSSVALLAYLSFQLPKLASDLLNGTASLSAGDAATNMASIAAMAVGAGAMAGAAGGSIKDGVSSALAKGGAGSISGNSGALGGAGGGSEAAAAPVEPSAEGVGGGGGDGVAVPPPADLDNSAGASGTGGDAPVSPVAPPASAGGAAAVAPADTGSTTGASAGGDAAPASSAPSVTSGGDGGDKASVAPSADLGSAAGASIGGGGSGASSKPKSSLASAMDAARSTHSAIHEITPNDSHSVGLNASIGQNRD